ncbi:MAG: hypothetical protein CMJ51_05970 [Planctomycetaceae bacterium]|nr:hypothetical protein [Planctomycetaceae bacterium]
MAAVTTVVRRRAERSGPEPLKRSGKSHIVLCSRSRGEKEIRLKRKRSHGRRSILRFARQWMFHRSRSEGRKEES